MVGTTAQLPRRLCSSESFSKHKIVSELKHVETIDRMNRIIGIKPMRELLQPRHNYFKDKQAVMVDMIAYKCPENEHVFCYPVVSGLKGQKMPRDNPYRRYQLVRSNSAKKSKMLLDIVEKFKLDDFKLAKVEFTMPEQISEWLSKEKNGREMAWRMFKKLWAWYNQRFGPGLAGFVNLHTWKTEMPLKPHYHFHCMIPNYKKTEVDILDDAGNKAYSLTKQDWYKQRGGREVPVSENEIAEIKIAWWHIIDKFARMHKLNWGRTKGGAKLCASKLDIYYSYTDIATEKGICNMIFRCNYQGRYVLEDYARYSNKNTDCPNPPGWLKDKENHARPFGWWREARKMVSVRKMERIKVHPVTGENMEYWGHRTIYELVDEGPVGFLDIIKGVPVFHRLTGSELAWLLTIQKYRHPAIERAMMWEYQAENEIQGGQY